MKKTKFIYGSILAMLLSAIFCGIVFGAYSSHQNDQDVNSFLSVYPFAKGTKLDDCSLCHPGGTVTTGGKSSYYGSCDYCHLVYGLQAPHGPAPLNNYGKAYNDSGRNAAAFKTIEAFDSDGDTFSNADEIRALSFPGDAADHPGMVQAPVVMMNLKHISRLPWHGQFMLANASKSTDEYVWYGGATIKDILKQVRIKPEATQITVFAPDGFSKTFALQATDPQTSAAIQYDVMGPYPQGTFYPGLDFVQYPEYVLGIDQSFVIPGHLHMLLGYYRDGALLSTGKLVPDAANPGRLVLQGEGPYRLVIPQKIAGSPDRPSTAKPVGDGLDYDSQKDHNQGFMVRSVSAIRVEPLPAGTTDFKWTEGGWNLVDTGKIVIYGAIDPVMHRIAGRIIDRHGRPLSDVALSLGLVSLGQIGSAASTSRGMFNIEAPDGEYVLTPFKEGYEFEPSSISINLTHSGSHAVFVGRKTQ
jgi:hypothetical protein